MARKRSSNPALSTGTKVAIGLALGVGALVLLKPAEAAEKPVVPPPDTQKQPMPTPVIAPPPPPAEIPPTTLPAASKDAAVFVTIVRQKDNTIAVPTLQVGTLPITAAADPLSVQSFIANTLHPAPFVDEIVQAFTVDSNGKVIGSWTYGGSMPLPAGGTPVFNETVYQWPANYTATPPLDPHSFNPTLIGKDIADVNATFTTNGGTLRPVDVAQSQGFTHFNASSPEAASSEATGLADQIVEDGKKGVGPAQNFAFIVAYDATGKVFMVHGADKYFIRSSDPITAV